MIKVVIVDDQDFFSMGVKTAIESRHPDLCVVGEAASGKELFALLETVDVDLVMLDIMLPDMNGVDIARRLKTERPELKILVISSENTSFFVKSMLDIGVDGFISKRIGGVDMFAEAIRSIMQGVNYFGKDISEIIYSMYVSIKKTTEVTTEFTEQEKRIIELCREGLPGKIVADQLNISLRTVNNHKNNIFRKLGINSTAEMVNYALKMGIIRILLLFSFISVQAQTEEKKSDLQLMESYIMQIDSAIQEINASKIASIYGMIVTLCRESPIFENELPENMYQYGMWSTNAGNHQTAINILIELLDMPHDPGDRSLFTLKARANNELGRTYFFLKRWDDALVHYKLARDMATELQINQGISIAENNIGNIFQKKENYQQAIEHYLRCLQLQEEIDDKETICNVYHNLATCYAELGSFKESLNYFDLASEVAKEIGDKEIEALSLIGLANYHANEKHQYFEAIKLINQAEAIAKEAEYNQVLAEVYQSRSNIDEKRGDFTSALNYFKRYKALSDELFNEQSMDQLHEYEVRYQTKEKELEILRQQLEINRQKNIMYISTIGLFTAGLLVVLLFYIIILRTRRNRLLADTNATKDKFFSIISHDLKNPAVTQRDAIQILLENSNYWDSDLLKKYYQKLLKSANEHVDLLYSLLGWAQAQTGRIPFLPRLFDLTATLKSDISTIKNMAEEKDIALKMQIPESTLITGDDNMLATVVRNLLVNAVKFTDKGGEIKLDITPCRDGARCGDGARPVSTSYLISVTDTGAGMTQEQVQNLFRLDSHTSRQGTAGETGVGLGLIVCKEFIEKHGSCLHIESVEGKGSKFWFEI